MGGQLSAVRIARLRPAAPGGGRRRGMSYARGRSPVVPAGRTTAAAPVGHPGRYAPAKAGAAVVGRNQGGTRWWTSS